MPDLALPSPAIPCSACADLPSRARPYPAPAGPILPYPALSCRVLPNLPASSCNAMPCHVLPFPVRSCPAFHGCGYSHALVLGRRSSPLAAGLGTRAGSAERGAADTHWADQKISARTTRRMRKVYSNVCVLRWAIAQSQHGARELASIQANVNGCLRRTDRSCQNPGVRDRHLPIAGELAPW